MNQKKNRLILFLLGNYCIRLFCAIESAGEQYPIRKFPGPLYSIGQNIVDKNILVLATTTEYQQNLQEMLTTISFEALYGITKNFSATFVLPCTVKHKILNLNSSGLSDVNLTFEYAYINRVLCNTFQQATVLCGVFFPTSRFDRNPPTGTGTWQLFFGGTASNLADPWYAFGSWGIQFIFKHRNKKLGNIFFYEWGFGRIIRKAVTSHLSLLLEFNGVYTKPTQLNNRPVPDTGSNIVFVGPTLRWNLYNFLLQAAVQYPLAQHLFGNNINKVDYRAAISLIWSF